MKTNRCRARWLATTALLATAALPADRQTAQTFERPVRRMVTGHYLLYLPETYGQERRQRWPLVLFLHGAGERGTDLEQVKKHGPPKLVAAGQSFPFILVSPQCPANQWWPPEVLSALLDEVVEKYAVDQNRIYVTGLSMGGFGTWALAAQQPDRLAAIAPICGGGDPRIVPRLKDLPVWAFHGALDTTVPPAQSQALVDALRAAGGNVRFTLYDDAAHDAWTRTYADPKFFEWLLHQQRRTRHWYDGLLPGKKRPTDAGQSRQKAARAETGDRADEPQRSQR